MARIARSEYDKIRAMVDVEGRKVTEVAATYGCSAANIYAILKAVRAVDISRTPDGSESAGTIESTKTPATATAAVQAVPAPLDDLFEALVLPPAVSAVDVPSAGTAPLIPAARSGARPTPPSPPQPASKPRGAPEPPAPPSARGKGGKPGYALLMRTSDGEEAVHPFRSLDELLASAKPILRTAARSPEPIWFSIQAVNLDTLADEDF